jgi:hypothetical protein
MSTESISHLFYEFIRGKDLNVNNVFMACNSLNSVNNKWNGCFNELLGYIHKNRDKKLLILCTNITSENLKNIGFNNITCLNLNKDVVQKIDGGGLWNIKLETDLFDQLILGCTHYDLINIDTNLPVISSAKLGAYKVKNMIDNKGGL